MGPNSQSHLQVDFEKYNLPLQVVYEGKRIIYGSVYEPDADIMIAYNDVEAFLRTLPDKSCNLIITSPPYNMGKPYEEVLEFQNYIQWQERIIRKLYDKLEQKGSIVWQTGNYVKDKEVFPLDIFFYKIFKEDLKMKLRNRIIWHFGHGLHTKDRFSGRYETALWFTKGNSYTFNLDEVRIRQKYPGKRSYRGPNKGSLSGNPNGKNPSDFWDKFEVEWEDLTWNIPNVKSNHPEKTLHNTQYPIELAERFILALTNEDDVVFDPFAGVGTTMVAASYWNRKGIGVDKEKYYTDIAYQRVMAALNGTLKRRPLGKPVYTPENSKLSNIPEEWKKRV